MILPILSRTLAAVVLLHALACLPARGQNGNKNTNSRPRAVVRLGANPALMAPPRHPGDVQAPQEAKKPAAILKKGEPRLGSHESVLPTAAQMNERAAEGIKMARPTQTVMQDKGMQRSLPKADAAPKPSAPVAAPDFSQVISALPKTYASGEPMMKANHYVRPQINEREMLPAQYPIVDDYTEVFITTTDRPSQQQALRLASIYLGRPAQAGEITMCLPSEGFILKLPTALAADAALRAKARTQLLAQTDVVTVTPSVKEGPYTYYLPGHVLANARPEMTLDAAQKIAQRLGAVVLEEHDQLTMRVFVLQVAKGADPRQFADVVKKAGMAPEVVPNVQATLQNAEVPNDPQYPNQWWLSQQSDKDIDAERAWDQFNQQLFDTWVDVAVVDGNGYDAGHEDWSVFFWNPFDAVDNDNSPDPVNADDNHGTPCAGLVGCNSDNGLGVASAAWKYTYVTGIKIGFNIVGLSFSTNATIISRMATHVINTPRCVATSHSYTGSGTFYSSDVLTYYQNIYNNPRGGKGAVLCAAAGNNNLTDPAFYPAQYSFAVTVAASDQNDSRAGFSNYGNFIEVTAPGVSTLTIDRTGAAGYDAGNYTYFAGTSAATPITAGACGVIARQRSSMGRDSIMMLLMSTCDKVGGYTYGTIGTYGTESYEFGYGRINMGDAVARVYGYNMAAPLGSTQANLVCGSVVSGNTAAGFVNDASSYYGVIWNESGPDANYTLTVNTRGVYNIALTDMGAIDLDVFLLEHEWAGSTIAYGNYSIDGVVLEPGVYSIVVDGYNGAAGAFTLSVTCSCMPTYANKSCASGDFIKSVRVNATYFDSSGCDQSNGIDNPVWPYNYEYRANGWPIYNNSNNYLQIRSGGFGQNYIVFIDFNGDNSFSSDELVYSTNTNTTDLVTNFSAARANFPVNQYRRMRIISSYSDFSSVTNSCPSLSWGETEDHLVYCSGNGWPITFGSTDNDYVRGLVRDATGNVYVSLSFRGTINFMGYTYTSASTTKRDMAIAKVSNDGALQWLRQVGNGSFDMEPQGVNIDGSGNPYWAGSFAGAVNFPNAGVGVALTAAGSYDAFTARFDPATGNCVWAKRVGGAGNDYLYGCFVSNSGNVYAGGSYTGAITFALAASTVNLPNAGGLDGFIVKFDPNGVGLWASRMGSTANDEVKSIEYNGGDLVACGYMGDNCTFPTGTNASPNLVTLGSVGDSRDGFAGRINSEGRFVWVKNFGSIFNDEAMSICYDPSTGNVFVAAQVADAPVSFNAVNYAGAGGNDIMVVGWNFYTQAPVWARRMGSTTGDSPSTIRWDGNRLVVAGYAGGNVSTPFGTLGTHGGNDAILLRYDKATGAPTSGLMIGGTGDDRALTMWCNVGNREEFVGGVMSNLVNFHTTTPRQSAGLYDGFVSRHFPPSGLREGVEQPAVAEGNAFRVYPVPASKELHLLLAEVGNTTPEVYDVRGTRLAASYRQDGPDGILDVSSLRAGIYLVRTGGRTARFVKE